MNSKFASLCVFSLMAVTGLAQPLTYDFIMKGFSTNIQGWPRQEWLGVLCQWKSTLTNEALKTKVAEDVINILKSDTSSNQDRCAAAYIIGLFSFEQGIQTLINEFMLYNNEPTGLDIIKLGEGEYPALGALVKIGEPATPEIINVIESNTNSYQLQLAAKVILFIKGQEDGAEFLKQAIDSQTDRKKKENLQAALSSEYFIDPKYRLSGPEEKVKRMLAQEQLAAQVTLTPETLNVSPGVLTAFVRLPAGYPARNITSATCDGAFYEQMKLNADGTEMIIKFRRQDIEKALAQIGESLDTHFVVRGVWRGAVGNRLFQGTASIKKIVGVKSK